MDAFPFTPEEWSQIQEAGLAVLNATLAKDDIVRASHIEGLRTVLTELRARYGDHPVLLETEADFSEGPEVRRELYRQAVQQAERAGLVTYSIRTALARVLLEDLHEPGQALAELLTCEAELERHADEAERREWAELVGRCRERGET